MHPKQKESPRPRSCRPRSGAVMWAVRPRFRTRLFSKAVGRAFEVPGLPPALHVLLRRFPLASPGKWCRVRGAEEGADPTATRPLPRPEGCRFQAQQEVAVAVGLSALPVHRSLASEGGRGSRVWRAMEWLAESHRVAEGLRVRGALTVHREPVHEAMSHPALRILKPL